MWESLHIIFSRIFSFQIILYRKSKIIIYNVVLSLTIVPDYINIFFEMMTVIFCGSQSGFLQIIASDISGFVEMQRKGFIITFREQYK